MSEYRCIVMVPVEVTTQGRDPSVAKALALNKVRESHNKSVELADGTRFTPYVPAVEVLTYESHTDEIA